MQTYVQACNGCGLIDNMPFSTDKNAIKAPGLSADEKKQIFRNVIATLETYSADVQDGIREVLYYVYAKKPCPSENIERFKKAIEDGLIEAYQDDKEVLRTHTQKLTLEKLTEAGYAFPEDLKSTKKARFEWCLAHASEVVPIAYPKFAFVRPVGNLALSVKKTYTYLRRKYEYHLEKDENGEMLAIPHGAILMLSRSPSGERESHYQLPDDDVTELLNQYGANRLLNTKHDPQIEGGVSK